jgi:hypothetical protein
MSDDSAKQRKRVPAIFFRTEAGGEPVREWLKALSKKDRKLVGEDIRTVELGWPIGMPTCRPLKSGLHEVRTNLTGRQANRPGAVLCRRVGPNGPAARVCQEVPGDTCGGHRDRAAKQEQTYTGVVMKRRFDHSGATFDSFLEEEGILEEVEATAVKRVIAWQLEQAMHEQKKSKAALARELHTSRTQVDRLLDPTNTAVSLATMTRAASVLGKRLIVSIGDKRRGRAGRPRAVA